MTDIEKLVGDSEKLEQRDIEKMILDTLASASEVGGATIQDVSQLTGVNRITVSKYLAVMEARGLVKFRPIGRAKLYRVKEGIGNE